MKIKITEHAFARMKERKNWDHDFAEQMTVASLTPFLSKI